MNTDTNRKGVRERLHREGAFFNEVVLDDVIQSEPNQELMEAMEIIMHWPEDCREVALMILEDPEPFLGETPHFARTDSTPKQRIKHTLREQGWTYQRIQGLMRDMKDVMTTLN